MLLPENRWLLLAYTLQGTLPPLLLIFAACRPDTGWSVLVYLRDQEPDPQFVELLISLREVDFIILRSDSLKHLCSSMKPGRGFCHRRW